MARNKKGDILIARFSAIGDVAMTIPVVYSVCETYPDTRFIMLTAERLAGMFVSRPANLIVEGVALKEEKYKGVGGMRRLVAEITDKYDISTFIDIHNVLRTRLIVFFCRLKRIKTAVIDKGRKEKISLTRKNNKRLRQLIPQIQRYTDTFAKAGFTAHPERFRGIYGGHAKADTGVFENITGRKNQGDKWIAVAPFAAHKGKIYPPEAMKKVVKELAALPNTKVFLFGGGADEKRLLEAWAMEWENVISLAGLNLGFAVELPLLNHCDVALTMDSANMHLAALVSTPVVAVWGATHPYTGFGAWSSTEADYIQLPMPCRPCSTFGNKPCLRGDYLCLAGIPPEQIAAKILSKLA